MTRTTVIAEAGSCHEGSLDRALALVSLAASSGADVCKFQFWSSASRLAARRRAPDLSDVYQRLRVPVDWLPVLFRACGRLGLEFLLTAYLPEDIALIKPFVHRVKLASFESDDEGLLKACAAAGLPVIQSLGMRAQDFSAPDPRIAASLHCVSAYPAPIDQLNLAVLRGWWVSLVDNAPDVHPPGAFGFSDHSDPSSEDGQYVGALAVAAGAEMLEVHFRLDDTASTNPDFPHSRSPEQLRQYIRHVRLAERMLGDLEKRVQPSEQAMLKYRVEPKR